MTTPHTDLPALIEQQANDPGLWFDARTASEAYLQQELRKLHAVAEHRSSRETTHSEDCYKWHHACAIRRYEAALRDIERLRKAERDAEQMAAVLPCSYYMDPPDGGDVSVVEQLRRMAQDAARYRLVRRKVCIAGPAFHLINIAPTYVAADPAIELDAVADAAIASQQQRAESGKEQSQ